MHGKLVALILTTLGLMLALLPLGVTGNTTTTLSIDGPAEVDPDDEFIALIAIDHVQDFGSGNFDLIYDQAVITVTAVTGGEIGGQAIPIGPGDWVYIPPGSQDTGRIRVIAVAPGIPGPGFTGSGYLAQIHFRVLGTAGSSSAISLQDVAMYDYEAIAIPTTTVDGSVAVAGTEPPIWAVPMAADAGEDGANPDLEFGIHPDATDGYDSGIDVPAPPAGPGARFDGCFSIVHPTFSRLNKDFRGEIPNQWTLEVWSTSEDIALSWDADAIPSELSALMDTGTERIDMKAQADVLLPAGAYTITISVSYGIEVHLSLKAGWNLVSVPVVPADPSVGVVFAGTEAVFAWDPTTRIYYTPGDVEPHRGYWVAVTTDTVITVSGAPVYAWTAEISAGWNLIGSVICAVDFSAPDTEPPGKLEPFSYRWDPVTSTYDYSTTIETEMGHWVAATSDCQLTLSSQGDCYPVMCRL